MLRLLVTHPVSRRGRSAHGYESTPDVTMLFTTRAFDPMQTLAKMGPQGIGTAEKEALA